MDKNLFSSEFLALIINYNHQFKDPEQAMNLYYNQLFNVYNLSDKDFENSINYLMCNSSSIYGKFPKVEDFLGACGKSPLKLADKAWNFILKLIPKYGRYNSLNIGLERRHMALYEAVDFCGGWFNICQKSSLDFEKMEFKFKEKFKEAYSTGNFKRKNHLIGTEEASKKEFRLININKSNNLIGR